MPGDSVTRRLCHRLVGVNDDASRYLGDAATSLAPDMLVMLARRFVARLAIPQMHSSDGPRLLQIRQTATDGRKIRRNALFIERCQHVVT